MASARLMMASHPNGDRTHMTTQTTTPRYTALLRPLAGSPPSAPPRGLSFRDLAEVAAYHTARASTVTPRLALRHQRRARDIRAWLGSGTTPRISPCHIGR